MPHTLLLADDSVTIQRVIELTFADEDVTVIAVSDGDQAIARMESSPPDIVLADIGMPGKNGYEVAQYVRNSPRLAHIPVVLLTGAFEPVDQARADDAGCDGVLAKPFEPQMVIGRVKDLLSRPNRAPAPTPHEQSRPDISGGKSSLPAIAPVVSTDQTTPSLVTPTAETQVDQLPQGQLNDYFDRLDAAFSRPAAQAAESSAAVGGEASASGASPANPLDWFSAAAPQDSNSEPWDLPAPAADVSPEELPLTYASPQPETPLNLTEANTFAAVARVEPPVDAASTLEVAPPAQHAPISAPDERLAPIEESAPVGRSDSPAAFPEPLAASAPTIGGGSPAASSTVAPARPAAPALELPLPNAPALPPLADAFAALLAAEQGAPLPTGALWLTGPPPPPPAAVVTDETIELITRRVLDRLSDTVVRQAVTEITSTIAERLIREEIERIKAAIK